MRSFLVLLFALFFVVHHAVAQVAKAPSRWTISAGPEWGVIPPTVWGVGVRAGYDLVGRNSPVRVGLLFGGSWGPTQDWRYNMGSGSYSSGIDQRLDLMVGVTTALTPLPRARVSPYFTFGVLARQTWMNGTSGSPFTGSHTYGQIFSSVGWGVRVKIGASQFQFEMRQLYDVKSLTFGMSLPF